MPAFAFLVCTSNILGQAGMVYTYSMLTVTPELGLEPVRPRNHSPALGAVNFAVPLSEAHRKKHVCHIVALIAQINLCACL